MFLGHVIEMVEAYGPARAIVSAEKHFVLGAHETLWACVWDIADDGQPCTYRTVASLAHSRGLTSAAEILERCQLAARAAPVSATKESQELIARAETRLCLEILDRARAEVKDRARGLPDVCSDAIGALCLFQSDNSKNAYTGSEASRLLEQSLDQRAQGKKQGVTTGNAELDAALCSGLVGGRVVALAARTGVGKTSLALGIASAAATAGARICFISFEMAVDELLIRLCAHDYSVPPRELFRGTAQTTHAPQLAQFHAFLAASKSNWISESAMSIEQLAGKVATLHAQSPIDLLVVDYVQQVDAAKNHRGNRVEEIEEVMRSLKALAGRLSLCVLAVAQLNRANESDGTMAAPNISNIHGSSSVERYADQVLLLHRATRDATTAQLIIGKNRHGPAPTIQLNFEPQFTRFTEGSSGPQQTFSKQLQAAIGSAKSRVADGFDRLRGEQS